MSDVFDKARLARERAAQVATGLKDGLAEKVGDAKDLLATGAADIRDAGLTRIREVIDDLNATLPAIRDAGYELTDVSINVGVAPTVVASFHTLDTFNEEHARKVIEENEQRKLAGFLIRALLQARKVQGSIAVAGLKARSISIQIGVPPSVSIKFA